MPMQLKMHLKRNKQKLDTHYKDSDISIYCGRNAAASRRISNSFYHNIGIKEGT